MDKSEKYTVRKLVRKDRVILTDLILKFVEKTDQTRLISMIPNTDTSSEDDSERQNNDAMAFTFKLITDMVRHLDEEIIPWFADLVGVSTDKFDTLPFDIEIDIIDQLLTRKGFVDFFLKALGLRKRIAELKSRF